MSGENSMRIGSEILDGHKVAGADLLEPVERELALFIQSNRVFWNEDVFFQKFAEISAHFVIVAVDHFLELFHRNR